MTTRIKALALAAALGTAVIAASLSSSHRSVGITTSVATVFS